MRRRTSRSSKPLHDHQFIPATNSTPQATKALTQLYLPRQFTFASHNARSTRSLLPAFPWLLCSRPQPSTRAHHPTLLHNPLKYHNNVSKLPPTNPPPHGDGPLLYPFTLNTHKVHNTFVTRNKPQQNRAGTHTAPLGARHGCRKEEAEEQEG